MRFNYLLSNTIKRGRCRHGHHLDIIPILSLRATKKRKQWSSGCIQSFLPPTAAVTSPVQARPSSSPILAPPTTYPARLDSFSSPPSPLAPSLRLFSVSLIPLTCSITPRCQGAGAHTLAHWGSFDKHGGAIQDYEPWLSNRKDSSRLRDAARLQLLLVSFSASQSSHVFLSPVTFVS